MQESIDAIQLNLGNGGLMVMNVSLAFIMFGVALELTLPDFKNLIRNPKSTLLGIVSQFFLLPLLTFILVWMLQPAPSLALGMFMVAACPGGNISNFFSLLARGNAALSVSLTAISTLLAIVLTPLNFTFWAGLYEPANMILKEVSLNLFQIFKIIGLILGIPLILGMTLRNRNKTWAKKMSPWIKKFGIIFFAGFVVVAFSFNFRNFINFVYLVLVLVFLHNAFALGGGYGLAALFNLHRNDRKSIAIETGIQNSGLALLLIFNFFSHLGGMALVAAWWGIWHIIVGLSLSWYWATGKAKMETLWAHFIKST